VGNVVDVLRLDEIVHADDLVSEPKE